MWLLATLIVLFVQYPFAGSYKSSPASESVNTAYVFSRNDLSRWDIHIFWRKNFDSVAHCVKIFRRVPLSSVLRNWIQLGALISLLSCNSFVSIISRPALQLPGASKPAVAVRFCPLAFSLRGSNSANGDFVYTCLWVWYVKQSYLTCIILSLHSWVLQPSISTCFCCGNPELIVYLWHRNCNPSGNLCWSPLCRHNRCRMVLIVFVNWSFFCISASDLWIGGIVLWLTGHRMASIWLYPHKMDTAP